MDRFSQVAAQLQNLRYSSMSNEEPAAPSRAAAPNRAFTTGSDLDDSDLDDASANPTDMVSRATSAADARGHNYTGEMVIRIKTHSSPSTASNSAAQRLDSDPPSTASTDPVTIKDEEMPDIDTLPAAPAPAPAPNPNPTTHPIAVYNIPAPQPTLTLPPNYPFRTTPLGYPLFTPPPARPGRPSMTHELGFMDPRVTSFVHYWTEFYTAMGNHPEGVEEGMFRLRLACHMRKLVTYGGREVLVVRLVERALRDAGRGWSEIWDEVEKVKVEEPPEGPPVGMGEVKEEEEEEGEVWFERRMYGGY